MKKSLRILFISIILIIVGVIVYITVKDKNKTTFVVGELINIENKIDYLVISTDGKYHLNKVNSNVTFNVFSEEDVVKYKIIDEDKNVVDTSIDNKDDYFQIININNYEAGKTYVLTLENANFVEEELKETKELTFTIVRETANTQVLNDDVIKVNEKQILNISETQSNFILTSTKEYKQGDIIYYENDEDIKTFKVDTVSKDNDTYTITTKTPTLEEVYSELDIYGETTPVISDFIANEELESYLLVVLEEAKLIENIWGIFGTTVEATDNMEDYINFDIKLQKDGSTTVIIQLKIKDTGNKYIDLANFKNHELLLEMELNIKLTTNCDITFDKVDIGANTQITVVRGWNLQPLEDYWEEFYDEQNKNDVESIEIAKDILKALKEDEIEAEQYLGVFKVPTPIAGLTVDISLSLIEELKVAIQLGVKETVVTTTSFGYKDGVKEINQVGFYYNTNTNIPDSSFEVYGKAEVRLGLEFKIEINFIEVVKVGTTAELGGYVEGQINYVISTNNEENRTDGFLEAGIYLELRYFLKVMNDEVAEAIAYENRWKVFEVEYDLLLEEKLAKEKESKLKYLGTYRNTEGRTLEIKINDNDELYSVMYDKEYKVTSFDETKEMFMGSYMDEWDMLPEGFMELYPIGIKLEVYLHSMIDYTSYLKESDSTKIRIAYRAGGSDVPDYNDFVYYKVD